MSATWWEHQPGVGPRDRLPSSSATHPSCRPALVQPQESPAGRQRLLPARPNSGPLRRQRCLAPGPETQAHRGGSGGWFHWLSRQSRPERYRGHPLPAPDGPVGVQSALCRWPCPWRERARPAGCRRRCSGCLRVCFVRGSCGWRPAGQLFNTSDVARLAVPAATRQ